jgi:hypothetical protein
VCAKDLHNIIFLKEKVIAPSQCRECDLFITFPIDDNKAKREGFDKTQITGAFRSSDGYPG